LPECRRAENTVWLALQNLFIRHLKNRKENLPRRPGALGFGLLARVVAPRMACSFTSAIHLKSGKKTCHAAPER
jgi:hypothetical protein